MDAYGQIGPEKDNYDEECVALAQLLTAGQTIVVKLADRGTQYELLLVRGDAPARLHTPNGELVQEGYTFVAALEHGSYVFSNTDKRIAPAYVSEKLGYDNMPAGEAISDFLNRLHRAMGLTAVVT